MVVPIIAGGAILAFITWGKDVFGEQTFDKIIKGGIALGILVIIYIAYKAYKAWMDAKEAAEEVVDDITGKVKEGWEWILAGTDTGKDILEDKWTWITTVTPEEFLPDIDASVSKVTPNNYNETYGPGQKEDVSLLQKLYWGPTAIILGTKDKTVAETKDIYKDITTIPDQLKTKFDQDVAKAKSSFSKLKFW